MHVTRSDHHLAQLQPFVPILDDRDDFMLRLFTVVWVLSLGFFWSWWLQPIHWVSWSGMLFNSALLAWATGLAGYLFFFSLRATRPNPAAGLPRTARVAMVVTKAPAEPWEVVEITLRAMLGQRTDRPYDVWLADEDPTAHAVEWCRANGVRISTRRGVADYHQPRWPRRTKTKEGNLAYFYDHYGYENYDFVAQFDADHVPAPGYLEEILRPFAYRRVGYVAAPSICDANSAAGWTVTARLYKEATLHGVVQAGCNGGFAPVCIGSHYAVRTSALKWIGGIGPELAEDYSTSLLMNSGGWQGAFAIDAEAHGDGPESFGELITQELQWARSLATVGVRFTRGRWRTIPTAARFRLWFSLIFYPIFGLQMLAGFVFPIVALALERPWVQVNLAEFWIHVLPASLVAQFAVAWMHRRELLRPVDAHLLGWQVMVFTVARWPWVLWGSMQGAWAGLRRRDVPFRVTPKGDAAAKALPLRYVMPMLVIATSSALSLALLSGGAAAGYRLLCGVSAVSNLATAVVVVSLHQRDNVRRRRLAGTPYPGLRQALPLGFSSVIATAAAGAVTLASIAVSFTSLNLAGIFRLG